jgi:hypothetical protein
MTEEWKRNEEYKENKLEERPLKKGHIHVLFCMGSELHAFKVQWVSGWKEVTLLLRTEYCTDQFRPYTKINVTVIAIVDNKDMFLNRDLHKFPFN